MAAFEGQFETILNDLQTQATTGDETQQQATNANIALASALRDVAKHSAEGDQKQANAAKASAGNHLSSLAHMAQPGDLWPFRMYSNQPGLTFHDQRGALYSNRPSNLVNPLTTVVAGGHGPRQPRQVAFEKCSTLLIDRGRSTVSRAAAEQARDAVWRRNNGLELAPVEFIGHGNGTLAAPRDDREAYVQAQDRGRGNAVQAGPQI